MESPARQLLLFLSHTSMLVETASNINSFNWPAGRHLLEQRITDNGYFLDYLRLLDCESQYPWSFGGGT